MRSEFNKAFKEHRQEGKSYSAEYKLGALWAWDYRQSKVDELNQELHLVLNNWNDLTNAIHARTNGTAVAEARQLYEKVDELQNLIDGIKKIIREAYESGGNSSVEIVFDEVEQLERALNGGGE